MKRMEKRILSVFLTLALAGSLAVPALAYVAVEKIELDQSRVTMEVGETLELEYTIRPSNATDQDVTWKSDDSSIAKVKNGTVTAVSEGETYIYVTSDDDDDIYDRCKIIVEDNGTSSTSSTSSDQDELTLSTQAVSTYGGLYLEKTLTAPTVSVKNGSSDVTGNYTITYSWTDGSGAVLGTSATQKVTLLTQDTQTYKCVVTAISKTDTTKVMTKECTYTVAVIPSCEVSGDVNTADGTVKFLQIKDTESGKTISQQLTDGIEGSATTPGIPGFTYMLFDTATVTGADKGTLSVESGTGYYLYNGASGAHLTDVTFTPRAAGSYTIDFVAYGEFGAYFGKLEIRVTGAGGTDSVTDPTTGPVTSAGVLMTKTCDSLGYTFTGSDFYRYNDADPVVSLDFGTPNRGKLLRNFAHGTGTKDTGEKYYTDSAADGQYHISTLTYLPKAGSSGVVSIPVTYHTRSGVDTSGSIQITIQNKTASSNFTDVTKDTVGTWAADSVDFAFGTNLMGGMGDKLFGPYENMTRGMLVTVLYRAAGSPTVATTTNQFRDLDKDGYYYKAVNWASSKNIVNGVETGKFAPNSPVTREQIAVILYRYAEVMGGDTDGDGNLNAFTDRASVDSYAVNAMTWAVSKGIITGTTATTLSPLDVATRAQVTVMLHRYLTM